MIITRETDYAIRILRSLLNLKLKNIREISDEQFIPRQFAYKISKKLERAGYIEIIRGAQGGCRLSCDLQHVTMMDLIHVMDRGNMLSACLEGNYDCEYRQKAQKCDDDCHVHESLVYIQQQLATYLTTISLHDLIFGNVAK